VTIGHSGAAASLRRFDQRFISKHLRFYEQALTSALDEGFESLIDVGCGVASRLSSQVAGIIPFTVGVDGFLPVIQDSVRTGPYTQYHCLDALSVGDRFEPESFDVAMALDVIEHFPKEQGYELLKVLEMVARRRVVIFTPSGFLPQGDKAGNPLQVHQSGWRAEDFERRGYDVTGVNGWKPLRGAEWEPRIRPASVGHRVSAITQPLITRRPNLAFQMLAVRDLS